MKKIRGFTLIELMMVITILGILTAVSIPLYQDYILRAKVIEVLDFASAAKTAVSVSYATHGVMPEPADSGVDTSIPPGAYFRAVTPVKNSDTEFIIRYTLSGAIGGTAGNKNITLAGTGSPGAITWTCTRGNLDAKYRPANCQ